MYTTDPSMKYQQEEVWFPLSEDILAWETDFHSLMLNDRIRMVAYEKAVKQTVKPGMIVLDLGTGTGILALWALEAGASHVYGIDVNASILERAHQRIASAGYADRFTALNALSFEVDLSERVDLVMSEILGNLADNEDMTPIMADAQKRFLKPDGIMLPRKATAHLVPVCSPHAHEQIRARRCRGVNTVYSLDALMEKLEISNPFNLYYDVILPRTSYLATPQQVAKFSFRGSDKAEYNVERSFVVTQPGIFTGFKGYFVAELAPGVGLDISGDNIKARQTSDCWKHCFLPIESPIEVKTGDRIALRYQRYYPSNRQSPFRQCYAWSGTVQRAGRTIHRFAQSMGERPPRP